MSDIKTRQRCYHCGEEMVTRGPAAGMCPRCDDTDKVEREAHQAEYDDRREELHDEFWGCD